MPLRYPHIAKVRSIMETPVLDERKWAKVPTMPTDAVLVDMEDTVAQTRKAEGRSAVVAALDDRSYFGDRVLLCRPNGLETPWWRDDVEALAKVEAPNVLLPMITRADDVRQFQQAFREHGADPYLLPGIETPGGVAHAEEIAEIERVVALVFGEGDLTGMTGLPIHAADGTINPMVVHARSRVYVAAAANGLGMLDIPFVEDIRDLAEFRARAEQLRIMGATGLFALYPPHVDVINDVFTPNEDEVAYARRVISAFEEAAALGKPAVQFDDGRAILIHDYKKAVGLLERAGLR
jgi:citrate lyase beta subunit